MHFITSLSSRYQMMKSLLSISKAIYQSIWLINAWTLGFQHTHQHHYWCFISPLAFTKLLVPLKDCSDAVNRRKKAATFSERVYEWQLQATKVLCEFRELCAIKRQKIGNVPNKFTPRKPVFPLRNVEKITTDKS